jgi:hypothetical protein
MRLLDSEPLLTGLRPVRTARGTFGPAVLPVRAFGVAGAKRRLLGRAKLSRCSLRSAPPTRR